MAQLPVSWSPKDPDETVNYQLPWAPQLAQGATIAPAGSVWLDAVTELPSALIVADTIADDFLSTIAKVTGGIDGATAAFINRVMTSDGETLEQLVLLPIVATEQVPLGDYETPRPQDLVARYPAFGEVSYDTIAVHLTDALTGVDTSWAVADYPLAIMALAAHNMSLLGIGQSSESEGYRREGVTGIRDGAFSVTFSDKSVQDTSGGTFKSTVYGRQYAILLRRNKAGPRLAGGGVPVGGWGPLAQQNDGGILPWAF